MSIVLCRRDSFDSLKSWLEEARENSLKNTLYVLVGTHLDMEEKYDIAICSREVSRKEAEEWMQQEEIAFYFETSSKSDVNVSKAFDEVAKQLFINALGKGQIEST